MRAASKLKHIATHPEIFDMSFCFGFLQPDAMTKDELCDSALPPDIIECFELADKQRCQEICGPNAAEAHAWEYRCKMLAQYYFLYC